ncbi:MULTISPECIES: phage major capsid protein [unclassified Microbacterium]|uniref:phage major capsid protein n=1 Tax=unclassified Microbacterium TaxID=2609290 RepID=UPI0030102C4F
MQTYPLTPSQLANVSAAEVIAFLKSPTLVARRFGEILQAQQFLGLFLLQKRFTITGGAIGVPINEVIRAQRGAEIVAPGGEYKLTPMSQEEYEFYSAMKDGLATEVTDEQVGRLLRQPIDDAFTFLQTELVFSANEMAIGAVASSITNTMAAGATWTTGKQVYKDALRVKAAVRRQKLGYSIDTVVLPGELYAEVIPELLEILPKDDRQALTDGFPTVAGLTWIPDDGDDITDPLFVDRRRLGGIAREQIPTPEMRPIGGDTGVEIASIRVPESEKTRLQARNVHVPIVTDPLAAFYLTGTEAP